MGAMRPVRRMGQRLHLLFCMGDDMTKTLERYKLEIVNNHGDRYIRCEPAPDGSWVMLKDVAALQARVAELERLGKAIATERNQLIGVLQLAVEQSGDTEENEPAWFDPACRILNSGFTKIAALEGGK